MMGHNNSSWDLNWTLGRAHNIDIFNDRCDPRDIVPDRLKGSVDLAVEDVENKRDGPWQRVQKWFVKLPGVGRISQWLVSIREI